MLQYSKESAHSPYYTVAFYSMLPRDSCHDDMAYQNILFQPMKLCALEYIHHNWENEDLLTVEYTLYIGRVTTWHANQSA